MTAAVESKLDDALGEVEEERVTMNAPVSSKGCRSNQN